VKICNFVFKHLEHAINLGLHIHKDNNEIVGCTRTQPRIVEKDMQISITTNMPV